MSKGNCSVGKCISDKAILRATFSMSIHVICNLMILCIDLTTNPELHSRARKYNK